MSRWGDFPPTLFPEIYLISGLELEWDCKIDIDGEGIDYAVHLTA